MISTLVELAGFACLVVAAWLWCPLVGLVTAGVVLLLIGASVGGVKFADIRRPTRRREAK